MHITREELLAKIQDIEWDDFEAKASKTQIPADIWRTVSAFSNTSGGWILCGVAQHGKKFEIEGVENGEKIENDFLTTIRNKDKFNHVLHCDPKKFIVDGKLVRSDSPLTMNPSFTPYVKVWSTSNPIQTTLGPCTPPSGCTTTASNSRIPAGSSVAWNTFGIPSHPFPEIPPSLNFFATLNSPRMPVTELTKSTPGSVLLGRKSSLPPMS